MVCRKPPCSVQKSMQQLLLSLQLQHSSWPIVVTLKAATKDNPKSVIFFSPEGFKALRFSLHRVQCHHCYFTSLAVAPSSLNHFGRCCADTQAHLHCPACRPLSSSITAGAYLQSWWVLLCYLPFKHPCPSQISQRASQSVSKPRLGGISPFKLSHSLRECFWVFFSPLGCPFSKLEAPNRR